MKIKALVVGSGGREHALAWTLALSERIEHVYVAPGNAGTRWEAGTFRAAASSVPIAADDVDGLRAFAEEHRIGLTVVGPELALSKGIVDAFRAKGLKIFGPTQSAARLETSKAFARDFMKRNHIPGPRFWSFTSVDAARRFAAEYGRPLVVKADGLAAGKGVVVCNSVQDVLEALQMIMIDRVFGAAGERVVLEERLDGVEVSILAITDGKEVFPLPPARDHKRIYDGNMGPNTGGMGAYAPVPDIGASVMDEIYRTILAPTVWCMSEQGTPYTGVLYAGLMITADGPKVLEYNCRFGDPETQAILPLLDADFADLLLACVDESLFDYLYDGHVHWHSGSCVTVALASRGYPNEYPTRLPISGLDAVHEGLVFHAGTAKENGELVTAGGRVLTVSARGVSLDEARERAYSEIQKIYFEGMHYRKDIGQGQ